MSFSLEILRAAQKQLARIDRQEQQRLVAAIRNLASEPRPTGGSKLTGRDAWRIRVGDYRVIYEIDDGKLTILVVTIAHRRESYR
ncbi:MAG: type II toxin-antitoxin system RelE/ParE family toxin [Desulfuromonadales bacterium]|nr:type II toxin-antitoxin system RelE/ParE family toxin [Desulfuromonadales bacterium]